MLFLVSKCSLRNHYLFTDFNAMCDLECSHMIFMLAFFDVKTVRFHPPKKKVLIKNKWHQMVILPSSCSIMSCVHHLLYFGLYWVFILKRPNVTYNNPLHFYQRRYKKQNGGFPSNMCVTPKSIGFVQFHNKPRKQVRFTWVDTNRVWGCAIYPLSVLTPWREHLYERLCLISAGVKKNALDRCI